MNGEQRSYKRFSVAQRVEHLVMITSFIVLAVTGLPQKFAEAGISRAIINLFGGIVAIQQVHHIAAVVLILSSGFHILALAYRLYVERARPSMLPGLKDVKDGVTDFLYNLGARKDRSQGGRYNWMEKVEYWSLIWGTLVMILTGFMLWNPIAVTNALPGEAIPAAKTAHGWEAVLAVLAVLIWHFYSVHLRHFNKSIFTGRMSEHEMLDEHPLELADIKAGTVPTPRDAKYPRRQKIFVPIAAIASVALVALVYQFMTFEQTAIETIPPRTGNIQVFAPLTPTPLPTARPTSTPQPTPETVTADWTTVSSALEKECAGCHNGKVAGLDLTTYDGVMKGGKNGPVVVAGDPANSSIVQKVAGGSHPGKLALAELAALEAWIKNGASETGEGAAVAGVTPTPAPPADVATWADAEAIFTARCLLCHINVQAGNLSLTTYAEALEGGKSGPGIVPGNPTESTVVNVQQKGGHPGMLSASELAGIIAWIEAGAPEQ
jgi:cytochrome b subunit of formate dehydrogenase